MLFIRTSATIDVEGILEREKWRREWMKENPEKKMDRGTESTTTLGALIDCMID